MELTPRSDRSPEDRWPIEGLTSKPRPNSEPALLSECHWAPSASAPQRAPFVLNGCSLCLVRLIAARLTTCYLPRRAPINGLRNHGERRPCPTTSGGWARGEPVALTLTALAPQLFRDLVVRSFCVSRFTVNKKAQFAENRLL